MCNQIADISYSDGKTTTNFGKLNVNKLKLWCSGYNEKLNKLFVSILKDYYPQTERDWMSYSLELIDPLNYHGLNECNVINGYY